MALLCPGISCLKKDKALDKTPDESDIPYHDFQIGSSAGVKWDSKQYDLHDTVSLTSTDVGESDFWRVEREVNEALWSFHVISAQGQKLYLSYDDSSNDVTLEFSNDDEGGKKRLFDLLAQQEGGYLIRAQNTTNRYIGSNGEILEIFEIDDPTESMQWLIVEYFDVAQPLMNIVCEVRHLNTKWISDSPKVDQPIPVRQKGNILKRFQKWNMLQMTSDIVKFSPIGADNVFATCAVGLPDGVLLEEETDPDITEYKMKPSRGGYKLQTNTQWVGLSNDEPEAILIRVNDEKQAPKWTFNVIHIKHKEKNSSLVVYFPPLDCGTTE